MTHVTQPSKNVKAKLGRQLDEAAPGAELSCAPFDYIDERTGHLEHDFDLCPRCRWRRLWHAYNAMLDDENEERAFALYQWALLDVSPRERAAVILQCERNLEAAALANFDMDLAVTAVTPRQRLDIGAAFERAKCELGIARYIPPESKEVPHGKAH